MNVHASVIITVRNDRDGIAVTLDSLAQQSRAPNEILVVDGGSTDGTLEQLKARTERMSVLRVIHAPGANIARGRNIGTEAARFPIIATTDAGCRLHRDWFAQIVAPFEDEKPAEFVAGAYHVEAETLLESVVGLATMRGQLEPFDPRTFNPSARSVAFTKDLWRRAGGWPEWLRFSEDTHFDETVRSLGARWAFAGDAVVYWRPRGSLRAIAKQFYLYGTGRGHTQINAASFRYNLRNAAIVLVTGLFTLAASLAWVPLCAQLAYFHGWTFHGKAVRIARRTGRWSAYPLTLLVMNVVLFSNVAGYLVGTWQRRRSKGRIAPPSLARLAAE